MCAINTYKNSETKYPVLLSASTVIRADIARSTLLAYYACSYTLYGIWKGVLKAQPLSLISYINIWSLFSQSPVSICSTIGKYTKGLNIKSYDKDTSGDGMWGIFVILENKWDANNKEQ